MVFNDSSTGITTGLYSANNSAIDTGNADSFSAWTDIVAADAGLQAAVAAGERVNNFWVLGGNLVIELVQPGNTTTPASMYRLVQDDATEIISASQLPVIDASWDGTNAAYITEDSLYFEGTGSWPGPEDISGAPFNQVDGSVMAFSGLLGDSGTTYIVTRSGYVFYGSGGSWQDFDGTVTDSTAIKYKNSDDDAIGFSGVSMIGSAFGFGAGDEIWAPTTNEGYAILDINGSNESVTFFNELTGGDSTNLFSTSLYGGNISAIVHASDTTVNEQAVFALTPNEGLWRGSVTDGYLQWVRE